MSLIQDAINAGTSVAQAGVNAVTNLTQATQQASLIAAGLSSGNLNDLHAGLQGFDVAAPGSINALQQTLKLATSLTSDPNMQTAIASFGQAIGSPDLGKHINSLATNANNANSQYLNYAAADAADKAADATWNPLDDASAKMQMMGAKYQLNNEIKAMRSDISDIIKDLTP